MSIGSYRCTSTLWDALFTEGYIKILALGLRSQGGEREDGLPNTVKELPVYLFSVGFGVGAVVVRVLFSRR
jgi:hypothetical protein